MKIFFFLLFCFCVRPHSLSLICVRNSLLDLLLLTVKDIEKNRALTFRNVLLDIFKWVLEFFSNFSDIFGEKQIRSSGPYICTRKILMHTIFPDRMAAFFNVSFHHPTCTDSYRFFKLSHFCVSFLCHYMLTHQELIWKKCSKIIESDTIVQKII